MWVMDDLFACVQSWSERHAKGMQKAECMLEIELYWPAIHMVLGRAEHSLHVFCIIAAKWACSQLLLAHSKCFICMKQSVGPIFGTLRSLLQYSWTYILAACTWGDSHNSQDVSDCLAEIFDILQEVVFGFGRQKCDVCSLKQQHLKQNIEG